MPDPDSDLSDLFENQCHWYRQPNTQDLPDTSTEDTLLVNV